MLSYARKGTDRKKILVTGGTVFVSRYIAEYYVAKGCGVYVLNRNNRGQSKGRYIGNHEMPVKMPMLICVACGNGSFDFRIELSKNREA